jgi:hypothetical protein
LGKRRRIVYAVPGHGNLASFLLEFLYSCAFLVRKDLGLNFVYAELPSHGLCGLAAIPSQHHEPKSGLMKKPYRFRSRSLDGVRNTKEACRLVLDCNKHHSLSIPAKFVCPDNETLDIYG